MSSPILVYRRTKGLRQEQLGELVGVSKAAVSNWERGKCMPKAEHVPVVAKCLGVDPLVLSRELLAFEKTLEAA